MSVAKVTLNGSVIVDMTDATAGASNIEAPYTAYGSTGAKMTGTGSGSGSSPVLQSKTNISPTESSQTITADNGYDGLSSVQINAISAMYVGTGVARRDSDNITFSGNTVVVPAGYYGLDGQGNSPSKTIPSGTAGTPTASKGTVSNHAISVTPSVTNQTGYITGSTKTGTAVSVSASELVSGTYNVSSSGTADVTNYASVSVPAMTLPSSTSPSSSGTQKAIIPLTTSTQYINIPTGYNGTSQYYQVLPMNIAPLSVTENGTYSASAYDVEGFSTVTVNVSGGGGGSTAQVDYAEGSASSTTTLTFSSLKGEPIAFSFQHDGSIATGTPSKVVSGAFDGTTVHAQTITNTSNAQVTYDDSSFSKSYSNGILTITSTGAWFITGDLYFLTYTYGGTSSNIDTKNVQVGSGATSITFTGLEDEPIWWSCIFKSNFSTSNGYQRVISADFDGTILFGEAMDSSSHSSSSYWTQSYSNGSLTITSQGTNEGGYFHQPGYYQLTYAIASASPYEKVSRTYTPTTSQQTDTITPSTGYDAIDRVNVTVEAVPTMTLPTAASATSSGTSKATITPTTSAQYLNIPTGYNDTAQYYTIAATSGGGTSSKNVQAYLGYASRQANSYGATSVTLTVAKTGTYKICWMAWRGSSSGTMGTNLHIGNTTGTNQTTWTGTYGQCITLNNQSLTANQVLTLYATSGSNSRTIYVGNLIIEEQ